jgi:hypothetical protein
MKNRKDVNVIVKHGVVVGVHPPAGDRTLTNAVLHLGPSIGPIRDRLNLFPHGYRESCTTPWPIGIEPANGLP